MNTQQQSRGIAAQEASQGATDTVCPCRAPCGALGAPVHAVRHVCGGGVHGQVPQLGAQRDAGGLHQQVRVAGLRGGRQSDRLLVTWW